MDIIAVSPSYYPCIGGAERLLQSVGERLVHRGHSVTVLTSDCANQRDFHPARPAGLPPDEIVNGVRVIRSTPVPSVWERGLQATLYVRGGWRLGTAVFGDPPEFPFGTPSGLRINSPLMFHRRPDVVLSINWHFTAAYWAAAICKVRRIPHVTAPILHTLNEWADRPVHRRMFRWSDAVIALTDAEREFAEARGARNVVVTGAGIDQVRFADADPRSIRARYQLGDSLLVGFVGRQDELKGVITLIEAMRLVWLAHPDVRLILAGPAKHRQESVTQLLESMSPIDRRRIVTIDDFSDQDAASIMAALDILVLHSVEDAFGMVMIEAWMSGKPVIAADTPSARCIISDGIDGLLTPAGEPGALAEAISRLLVDSTRRHEMGKSGRSVALERYTLDRVTDGWEATLRAASRRAPLPRPPATL